MVHLRHTLWNFIKLTRPLFLFGGLLLYLLGAFAAVVEGAHLNIPRLVIGQFLITAIQLMTHYSNEFYDLEGDRLNTNRTWFSGGSGMLDSGAFSPVTAWRAALIFAGAGLLLLIAVSLQIPAVLPLGLLGMLAAWSYSGPPFALVRTGWGELSASLVVAFMVPVVGYMLQSGGAISPTILVACIPLILLHFSMLIAFQIPDWAADRAAGKHTLAVRFGISGAIQLHNLSIFAAVWIILGLSLARWPGSQFTWLMLPLAIWQLLRIRRYNSSSTPPRYLWLTMGALGLFALTASLWVAGFILLWIKV